MKLVKFRVRKFRSVQDSGWVELNNVNALMGENESGKTNLLLPLWKLKPSSGGKIDLVTDAPRGEYTEIRETPDADKPIFISAIFQLSRSEQKQITDIAHCPAEWVELVSISRRYDGQYFVSFINANPAREVGKDVTLAPLQAFYDSLDKMVPNKKDTQPRQEFIDSLGNLITEVEALEEKLKSTSISHIQSTIENFDVTKVSKTGGILESRRKCLQAIDEILAEISQDSPTLNSEAKEQALHLMPNFIYYSNYGNLDGQIYLPRVIADLERRDLTEKELAKVRTVKVLFEYVKLDPKEIHEMGKDVPPGSSTEQIEAKANQKRERTILLDSAATQLSKSFREWWRQGNYTFKFVADGDHFKIWVSDTLRPEPIELEHRSTGLQWFFSFFLVFLNERHDEHYGSILLLDEPGVTLHPLAQQDLFEFFEGIGQDNQIIYTTHSPFLMDPDKLDQVNAVYVDAEGYSCVSADLRARATNGEVSAQKAVFPVHSALGLTISRVLFIGCKILLVEGPSDQFYLSAIKNILIAKSRLNPQSELLFVPAGGAKGVISTSKTLAYDDNDYPKVLLDSDSNGIRTRQNLQESHYAGRENHLFLVGDFVAIENAEVEDFMDTALIAKCAARQFRGNDDFEDLFDRAQPIIPQIEAYCSREKIPLAKGWKVDLAREVKRRMSQASYISNVSEDLLVRWLQFFVSWTD